MYAHIVAAHVAVLSLVDRSGDHAARLLVRAGRSRRDTGQSTAEYALVLLGAATVAVVFVAWAGKTGRIAKLFNSVLDTVIGKV